LYGIKSSNLDEAVKIIEEKLNITFSIHESSYRCGEYYLYKIENEEEIIIQKNYDTHMHEWSEEDFPDYPYLLYISIKSNFKEIKDNLSKVDETFLLR